MGKVKSPFVSEPDTLTRTLSSPLVKYAGTATVLGGLGALAYYKYKKRPQPVHKKVYNAATSKVGLGVMGGVAATQVAAYMADSDEDSTLHYLTYLRIGNVIRICISRPLVAILD